MLSIARSRLALASQFMFLAVNAFALVLGLVYNHKTPELYENNVHSKIGWIITWVASAWVGMALIEAYASRTKDTLSDRHAGNVLNAANIAQYQRVHNFQASSQSRWSNDSGQGTERNSVALDLRVLRQSRKGSSMPPVDTHTTMTKTPTMTVRSRVS